MGDDESVSACSSGGAWTHCTVTSKRTQKKAVKGPSAVFDEILGESFIHVGCRAEELDHNFLQVRQSLDELRFETQRARSEARHALALAQKLQHWAGSLQVPVARGGIGGFKAACGAGRQSEDESAWLVPSCCSATLRVQEVEEELSLLLARIPPLEAEMTLVTHFRTRLESLEAKFVTEIESRMASIDQRIGTNQQCQGSVEKRFVRAPEYGDEQADELERPFCPPAAVCRARLSVGGLPEIENDFHTRVQTLEHRAAFFEPSLLWLKALREMDVAKHFVKSFANELHQGDAQRGAVFDVEKAVCRPVASREGWSKESSASHASLGDSVSSSPRPSAPNPTACTLSSSKNNQQTL